MGATISRPRCIDKITSSFRTSRPGKRPQVVWVFPEPSRLLSLPPELRLIIYEYYLSSFTTPAPRPDLLRICRLIRIEAIEVYKKHLESIWKEQQLQAYWSMAKYRVLCQCALCEAEMRGEVHEARSAGKRLCRELRLEGGELHLKALRVEIDMNGLAIKMLHSLPGGTA